MAETKEIKAESFDIMQYFYGAVHEPLIRFLIRFSGKIDEAAIKKAVDLSLGAIPLLVCRFDTSAGKPCWRTGGLTAKDIIHVVEEGIDTSEQIESLLASKIDAAIGPQLKIYLNKRAKIRHALPHHQPHGLRRVGI